MGLGVFLSLLEEMVKYFPGTRDRIIDILKPRGMVVSWRHQAP